MALTQVSSGLIDSTAQYTGFKNRIINGAMMIDQRNAGASVTVTGTNEALYCLDRWYARTVSATGSRISIQRSSVAPAGFVNSQLATSLSSYTLGASEHFNIIQPIEGLNLADFAWGTASATPVTLSFWVRSSLTGTFGGNITNHDSDRNYVFSYTINSANTWEQKSITIAGDTTGTWLTTNGVGLYLSFSLGAGSSVTKAAGSWGSFARSVTGQTSLVGTNGATFYITGVMLEKGSTATSYDYRPYGTELALCQRYFEKSYNSGDALGTGSNYTGIAILQGSTDGSSNAAIAIRFQVPKRTNATMTYYNADSGASGTWTYSRSGTSGAFTTNSDQPSQNGVNAYGAAGASWVTVRSYGHWAASAEL